MHAYIRPDDPRRLDVAIARVRTDFPTEPAEHFLKLRRTFLFEASSRVGSEREVMLAHAAACHVLAVTRAGGGMPCLHGGAA